MKNFNEWVLEREIKRLFAELFAACCSSEINEVLRLTNINTNDLETSKNKLLAYVKKQVGDRKIEPKDVVNTIRHQFTTYDQEWKNYDRLCRNITDKPIIVKFIDPSTKKQYQFDLSDLDGRSDYWRVFTHAVHDLVAFLITKITNPSNQAHYLELNRQWLLSKQERINY